MLVLANSLFVRSIAREHSKAAGTMVLKIGKLALPFITTIRLIVSEADHFEDGLEIDLGRFDLKQIEILDDSVKMTVVARI